MCFQLKFQLARLQKCPWLVQCHSPGGSVWWRESQTGKRQKFSPVVFKVACSRKFEKSKKDEGLRREQVSLGPSHLYFTNNFSLNMPAWVHFAFGKIVHLHAYVLICFCAIPYDFIKKINLVGSLCPGLKGKWLSHMNVWKWI